MCAWHNYWDGDLPLRDKLAYVPGHPFGAPIRVEVTYADGVIDVTVLNNGDAMRRAISRDAVVNAVLVEVTSGEKSASD